MNGKSLNATHGIVCSMPKSFYFGYYGWPSITKLKDGTLVVSASGLRHAHIDPWGKTVLFYSKDEGQTWTGPNIINDTPLDDRDVGLLTLDDGSVLASWFTLDIKSYTTRDGKHTLKDPKMLEELEYWDARTIEHYAGSYVMKSQDGYTFGERIRVPVTAPHGPIQLKDGSLFYLGRIFHSFHVKRGIVAYKSYDRGLTWEEVGIVNTEPFDVNYCHEPHAVELDDGKIIGMIRYQKDCFTFFQIESEDGGKTWSTPIALDAKGSPPHLLKHSSGALVCVYGYRGYPKTNQNGPYGQMVMISYDNGKTWEKDLCLRLDSDSIDLGYPASVELDDKSIFTIYYQQARPDHLPGILWSRWTLPE